MASSPGKRRSPYITHETIPFDPSVVNLLDTRRGAGSPSRCPGACSDGGHCGGGFRFRNFGRTCPHDAQRLHGLCRRAQSRRASTGLYQPQLPAGLYRIRSFARAVAERHGRRIDQFRTFGGPRNQYLYRRFEPFQQLLRFGADAALRGAFGHQHHPRRQSDASDGSRRAAAGQGRNGPQNHAGLLRRGLLHRERPPCARTAGDQHGQSGQEPQAPRTGT